MSTPLRTPPSSPIIASRLISLTLTANVIGAKTQQQLAALATKLVTPHLNELKILRPVPSAKDYERSMFDFLEATKSLQHVTICCSFVYKAGLRQYLQSDAAKHLVSLRLEASGTSKITDALWRGLCGEQHNLPELQQLTLRKIPDLTPKALCDKYNALHVETYKWFDLACVHVISARFSIFADCDVGLTTLEGRLHLNTPSALCQL